MIPKPGEVTEFTSLKDLNMYPLLYLQEHYPLIGNMFRAFTPEPLSPEFLQQCNSELYLQEFATEIENVIHLSEEHSTSSLSLPSVLQSIDNLGQIREIYQVKEVKEVTDIISSEFIMSQLRKSMRSRAIIHEYIHKNSQFNKLLEIRPNPNFSPINKEIKRRMISSDPKFLESILSGFDSFTESPFMKTTFPYLNNSILSEINHTNALEKELREILSCLEELELSFKQKMEGPDQEIKAFIEKLNTKFHYVFNGELNNQIKDLSEKGDISAEMTATISESVNNPGAKTSISLKSILSLLKSSQKTEKPTFLLSENTQAIVS